MLPLVDMHCHLLAGMDDGPRTDEDALAMCRVAYEDGTRVIAAGAHQNERYRDVTPDRIRAAADKLAGQLRQASLPLTVFPCAEVMVRPDLEEAWKNGEFLSVADRGQYLLVEMPHNLFVDLRGTVKRLRQLGVRPILAHPEKCPELLHDPPQLDELIAAGCLVQVSAASVTDPPSREDERALKRWFRRGAVHLLGSDGHSPRKRPPKMGDAYRKLCAWGGPSLADRVASTNGLAVTQGLPLQVPRPAPAKAGWFPKFW
jgi:protein-tyrosine phosphatase